ncbi:MAG: AraC family transcriptional regulator [Ketobacteraceae bacterium]|nr:AraC family transcriptional regulator [Ketobacteraceae bacterium]
MSELKDAGFLIRLAYQGMENMGINTADVLNRIGMSYQQIQKKDLRTPHSAQKLFWDAITDVSQDPDIGLHLGEHLPVFRGQVIEYLFLSSPTFGEGLQRALDYQRLISDAVHASLHVESDIAYLANPGISSSIHHLIVCVVLGVLKFFDYITDGAFQAARVDLDFPEPENLAEYERVFGCELSFGNSENRIYFSAATLDIPSLHAEPELLKLHEQLASEYVAKLEKQDFVGQVNRIIGELLESGNANLETVAERLDIKPRALRTRLSDVDTNFNQLLADYRCNLAKKLLAKTDESIDEIVYLTGFSEPSTFYRAFKRWTDLTPIEYRKTRQGSR